MFKNVIANLFGKFWGLLSNFVFIPIYIKLLGFDSYSIISFGLMISGILAVLDSGLTATLSREMSRSDNSSQDKQRIFKSLESIYFIITAIVIMFVLFNSSYIATVFVNTKKYTVNDLIEFICFIGIDVGFQLLIKFYLGGLIGMEQQVVSNLYQISWGIVRAGLVVVALLIVPSLKMFFIWQAGSSALFGFVLCLKLRKVICGNIYRGFSMIEKQVIQNSWKFTRGMLFISFIAALNTQMDKLAISKFLPVEELGYYTLATSLSMGLMFLVSPFSTAILPRLTNYFTANLKFEAHILFSKVQNLVSILVMSFCAVLFFNSYEIIWIWTGEIYLANHSHVFLKILSIGVAFLALAVIPFNVAIANGYTKLNNVIGLLSLLITIPGYWIFTKLYGSIGSALVYSVVQVLITLTYLYQINRKFFYTRSFQYIFLRPIFFPLLVSFTLAYGFSLISDLFLFGRLSMILWISIVSILIICMTSLILLPKSEVRLFIKTIQFNKYKW
jgi:O-antigen/teichoic acid export membrane protein